ncbi:hypothetical protein M426DRAFT_317898 [Hypoxylon sp. CI-4A]|nr:hypothetical protein M426DRAFT_317898 [Hypoxylon sp. CI-4A]
MAITLPSGTTLGAPVPGRGRSVLAARTFGPGSIIAEFNDTDNPIVAIPDNPRLATTCSYCLLSTTDPSLSDNSNNSNSKRVRACQGCQTSHYCSKQCQKADWKMAHGQGECKAFQVVRNSTQQPEHRILPTPTRALIQILLRPALGEAVDKMEGHIQKVQAARPGVMDRGTWDGYQLQGMAGLSYLGRATTQDNLRTAAEYACKLQINSFNRADEDAGERGFYVNAALAMVNHSCVPNAFVRFTGRNAFLHAYREIEKGEEVTISYIEVTLPLSERQKELKTRYHFECGCPRCISDLDVYEVCQKYPHLELNSFSLVPDLDKLRNPPIKPFSGRLKRVVEDIYPICSPPLEPSGSAETKRQIGLRWKLCQPLREAGLFAIDPVTQVFYEASTYFATKGNRAYSLALWCFISLHNEPYIGPMPFHVPRMKSMLTTAKFFSVKFGAPSSGSSDLAKRIAGFISEIDQATVCQVIVTIVLHYVPMAHSKNWHVYRVAKALLDDIEKLPGRETEKALVNAFAQNLKGAEEARFFNTVVLEPLRKLADFALEIMDEL